MPAKRTQAENVLELERLIKKVLRNSFHDNTLDYTVQVGVSSTEPGKVKYGFIISGLKKEIQPIALSYYTFNDAVKILEGMLVHIDKEALETNYHEGRINVYKNAIKEHEDRIKQIAEQGVEENDGIEMEKV